MKTTKKETLTARLNSFFADRRELAPVAWCLAACGEYDDCSCAAFLM